MVDRNPPLHEVRRHLVIADRPHDSRRDHFGLRLGSDLHVPLAALRVANPISDAEPARVARHDVVARVGCGFGNSGCNALGEASGLRPGINPKLCEFGSAWRSGARWLDSRRARRGDTDRDDQYD